nr:tetratricopeptide repeat protein [uncultured Duganella sp.]
MSLINKMLQDLDARGGAGEEAVHQQEVKAVPLTERDRRPLLIGGAAAGVLLLAAGGWYDWQYWKSHSAPPPGPVPKIVDNRPPSGVQSQPPPPAASQAAPAAVAAVEQASAVAAASLPAQASAPSASGDALPATAPAEHAEAAKPARPVVERAHVTGHPEPAAVPHVRKPAPATVAPADGVVVRELTPKQMSENSYRRALAALQEGRVNTALADLDKAVEIDPRNDAARQTYVSLLLENRRTDDAIRQLRLALGIDARQPGLAMVLARLQLEKGGPALDTLLKTLPYAGNSAEYFGFLAGVLQREQRHSEAVEQYRSALAIAPDNAVWWMGLGISLQAEQHLPEAREAYRRARGGSGLTPELKSFIDRKLDQLSR